MMAQVEVPGEPKKQGVVELVGVSWQELHEAVHVAALQGEVAHLPAQSKPEAVLVEVIVDDLLAEIHQHFVGEVDEGGAAADFMTDERPAHADQKAEAVVEAEIADRQALSQVLAEAHVVADPVGHPEAGADFVVDYELGPGAAFGAGQACCGGGRQPQLCIAGGEGHFGEYAVRQAGADHPEIGRHEVEIVPERPPFAKPTAGHDAVPQLVAFVDGFGFLCRGWSQREQKNQQDKSTQQLRHATKLRKSVHKSIDIHAGAHRSEEHHIAGMQALAFDLLLDEQVEEGGHGGDARVAEFVDAHGHHAIWGGTTVAFEEAVDDGFIHFLVGLVDDDLLHFFDRDPTLVEAQLHGLRHLAHGKFVNLAAEHFDVAHVRVELFVEGAAKKQEIGFFFRVAEGGMGEDAAFSLLPFNHRSPGPIRINHAVAVVRIEHPGKGFGPDHEAAARHASTDEGLRLDDAFDPARTAEEDVVGHATGVFDAQVVLYATRQARQYVGLDGVGFYIAEIMRQNDIVEGFGVDAGIGDGFLGGQQGDVGSLQAITGIAPFFDAGDLLEFLRYHLIAVREAAPIFI